MAAILKYASLLTTATAGVLIAATTLNHPTPQEKSKEVKTETAEVAKSLRADSPQKVAELLDSIVQPRFQKFGDGRFGVDRLVRTHGHDRVRFEAETPEEQKPLNTALAANYDFVIMLLHTTHVSATAYYQAGKGVVPAPGAKRVVIPVEMDLPDKGDYDLAGRVLSYIDDRDNNPAAREKGRRANGRRTLPFSENSKAWQKLAIETLPRLSKGQKVDKQVGDWLLAMRPVRAEQKACLGCHTESKVGDVLGVMVYAVNRHSTPSVSVVSK